MTRLFGFLIFAVILALLYVLTQYTFGQWFSATWLFKDVIARVESDKTLAIIILAGYTLMATWILVAMGRWMLGLIYAVMASVRSIFGGASEQAASLQTLDNTLIIDSPTLKKPAMRVVETIFSAAIWIFFMYLFQTIITAVGWLLGLEHIYAYNFTRDSIDATLEALLFSVYVAGIAMIVLFTWAQWNLWRFGGLDRRRQGAPVSREEVAQQFSVSAAMIDQMQAAKIATILPVAYGIVYQEVKEIGEGAD